MFMDTQFWLQRWEARQTGFHQQQVNHFLQRYWPTLGLNPGSRVLVPLCGKSLDMLWLEAQGCSIIGIELSRIAAESFFTENELIPEIHEEKHFTRFVHKKTELICGDFFRLAAEDIGQVDAFYDRAALIALTPEQRPGYASRLAQLIKAGTPGLLITLDYNQHEMNGPPFAVSREEVLQLFESSCAVVHLFHYDALKDNLRFSERGVTGLAEHSYRLMRI
jgi:thiopurine S-methyltransferase